MGKYNSTTCESCHKTVRDNVYRRFLVQNPGYWKKWQQSTAGRESKRQVILRKYGLTSREYNAMVTNQGSGCAICGAVGGWKANGGALVIDHDHKTGVVRGLLCPPCNRGLGQFEDDVSKLYKAVKYILSAQERMVLSEQALPAE